MNTNGRALWTYIPLFLVLLLLASGCATSHCVHYANGSYAPKEDEEAKPHPAMWAVLPFAVVVDIPLLPVYAVMAYPWIKSGEVTH
jgi:uncharacterized protein YceK